MKNYSFTATLSYTNQRLLRKLFGYPECPVKRRQHCSRTRFKKILMAHGFSRNEANACCNCIAKVGSSYFKHIRDWMFA